jgi:hypothetical protein
MDIIHISVRTFHCLKCSFHINANRPWIDSIYAPMDDTADTICTARIPSFMLLTSLIVRLRLFFNILHPPLNVPALCTSRVNLDAW